MSINLAERLNPKQYGFSPKMTAIVGAILGHDYGVRDRKGGRLLSLSITSDGFIVAQSTASNGGGALVGDAQELKENLTLLLADAKLTREEEDEFRRVYATRVRDWRVL